MEKAHYVEIVAHRGANELAPENTMAAIRYCLDFGVDYIELDVRTSSDGIMYNIHDPSVDRTTCSKGAVCEIDSSEIDRMDAGSKFSDRFKGERIPRIENILAEVKGSAKVFFDVKDADIKELAAMVVKYKMEDDCFFWFEEDEKALELKKVNSNLSLKMNASSVDKITAAEKDYCADIIECSYDSLCDPIVEKCRELDVKLMVRYGDNDSEIFSKILKSGADMANIDYPDLFVKLRNTL